MEDAPKEEKKESGGTGEKRKRDDDDDEDDDAGVKFQFGWSQNLILCETCLSFYFSPIPTQEFLAVPQSLGEWVSSGRFAVFAFGYEFIVSSALFSSSFFFFLVL